MECIQYCLREACDVAQFSTPQSTACQRLGGGSDPSHNPHKVQWESQHTPRPLCKKISTIFHYQLCHMWIWRLKRGNPPSSSCIPWEKDLIPMRFQWGVIARLSRLKHCNSPAGAPLPWQRWMPPSCRRHRQRTRVDSCGLPVKRCPDMITVPTLFTNYIWLYIPRTQLTSIFESQPSKTLPFPIKPRAMWVPGIHTLKLSHIHRNQFFK